MERDVRITKPCPHDDVGFLNRLFFHWLFPVFQLGYKKNLELSDLYQCAKSDNPETCANRLEAEWIKEQKTNKDPQILKAIRRTFGWYYLLIEQILFVAEVVLRVSQPFFVGNVIRFFTKNDARGTISATQAYWSVLGLCFTAIAISFSRHHHFSLAQRVGMNVRSSLTILVYKKLLRLSASSFETANIGQILNLISNDFNRFDEICANLYYLVIAPIQSIVVIYIMWQYLSYACLGGIAILFLFIPFQALMGRFFRLYRRKATVLTDKRVKLMSEIISAMKLIKVYCWERPFADLVAIVRKDEVETIKRSSFLKATNNAIFFVATRIMLFASFIVHIFIGGSLDAETVFVTMALFNTLRIPVTNQFPNAIGLGAETLVAVKRVQKLLTLKERRPRKAFANLNTTKGMIDLRNYTAKWNETLPLESLKKITLRANPGELVMVIGSVGAGKTCLLYSLLNELEDINGACDVSGSTSYSPQEAWCFGATIRNNILLGGHYDEKRYNDVIEVCGLQRDMEIFPNGDQTFVGEKGYTLSGGQKARITLARAVYKESDIYLLDDPLSAVDPMVANHIFEKCVNGFLKSKTVILVTHQLQFLKHADKIIILNDGQNIASGNYEQLINSGIDFLSLLESDKKESEKNELMKQRSRSIESTKSNQSKVVDDEVEQMDEIPLDDGNDDKQLETNEKNREEKNETGAVKGRVYWDYVRSGGSIPIVIFAFAVTIAAQVIFHFTDFWLSDWTKSYEIPLTTVVNGTSTTNFTIKHATIDDEIGNVITYSALVAGLFICALLRSMAFFVLCLTCSINLHNLIFRKLLRAPLNFFETNPLGRILNRFTRDVGQIDQKIPPTLIDLTTSVMNSLGIVAVSSVVNPWLTIPAVILIAISIPFRFYYIETTRAIRRLDATTKSPVYGHISATFDGLTTIRAFGLETQFETQYHRFMSDATSCRFMNIMSGRWVGFVLDLFALAYLCTVAIVLVVFPEGIPAGQVGLVLSSVLTLIGMFQGAVRQTAEFENQMVSVERVIEYGKLEHESALTSDGHDPDKWPSGGELEYNHVSLLYPKTQSTVLSEINFKIGSGEKIGIVGRTGAGKSSLITVLFRLVEPVGVIRIDGLDTKTLGLHELRGKISIIPQDPVLFSGTIRRNLDPFREYDDEQLWMALEEANLKQLVTGLDGKLDGVVMEGGSNLSVGQRQLLCLARALLKKNKILVLDEATANVDHETDELIQKTIKTKFTNCTVLTIAHRLNTIIDMDKVMVLDAGRLVEYDEPYNLLKAEGFFYRMVQQTGKQYSKILFKLAETAHYERID